MLSSNLCCRFETVPHCEKKRSTSPPEVGCVIKNSTLSWNGEGARDCHHSCKAFGPFISTTLQRMYRLQCSAISGRGDKYHLQMTFNITENFHVFNFPHLSKSLNVWKAWGKQGGGGPSGRVGEELTGFYF